MRLTSVEVSDWTQVQDVIAKIVKDFGKIDVFVANAGLFILPHYVPKVPRADNF